jgi:uncharacterized membrane protein YjjB (DUF3815 family)
LRYAGQHCGQHPLGLVDPRPQESPVPPGCQRLVLGVHGGDQLLEQLAELSGPVASLVVGGALGQQIPATHEVDQGSPQWRPRQGPLARILRGQHGRQLGAGGGAGVGLQRGGPGVPGFGASVTILGHVVLTVGICLVLQPTWGDLGLAALFGALVAVLKRVGGRWTSVQMIMPVVAAFVVAATTFLLAGQGWAEADLRAMIAPLVTFLPGAALAMAVVELSAAEMITGASRLVAGTLQLLLLGFGIVGAAQVVGLPSADALVDTPTNQLGWWAPWVGVLLVGIGNYLYFSAPGGSLGWLLLVLYAAWIGQYLGDQALGGYLSGFVRAIVMIPVAYFVERRPSGPPALVSFLTASGCWSQVHLA